MSVCVKVKNSNRGSTNSRGTLSLSQSLMNEIMNIFPLVLDFSIYDFAHSGQSKARAPKSNVLAVNASETDEVLDEEMLSTTTTQRRNDPSGMETAGAPEEVIYCDYTIDIWFLISEHVRPEDVGRFALICRKTAEVVQSAKFWHHLYRKHYDRNVDLPRWLQPDCMVLMKGLRARTVRALYYTYQPFVNRIAASAFTDPHRVTGRQLIFSWYTKCKSGWNYCFKLKTRLIPGSRAAQSARMQEQRESLEYLRDMYANPEEGCQILIITTNTMHLLPQYHEQLTVKSFTQTLAQGFTNYKVRLQMADYSKRIVDEMVFVPVRRVRLLDWWNPEYYREDPTIEKKPAVEEEPDEFQQQQQLEFDPNDVYWHWED